MPKFNTAELITIEYLDHGINPVETVSKRTVFVEVSSISMNEFYKASNSGFKPTLKLIMFEYDYNNEALIEFENERYSIVRSYTTSNDKIELILEKKLGD